MSSNHFQTIVVGAGALGAATAYWLAARGQKDVLVLEQFELGHSNGSSEDHSRIIRHSYHSSTYGRLTQAAYDNWSKLERTSGQRVLFKTGGLDIAVEGTPGVHSVEAYRRTLTENGHDFERLTKSELLRRWPQWNIEDEVRATYQKDSGILDIRRACQTHIALAQGLGVIFKANTAVRDIESSSSGVTIHTDSDVFTADHVVLCAGAWTDVLLDNLGRTWNTKISQEQVSYFATSAIKEFSIGNFPLWVWHGPTMFYGFPVYGEVAIKVSRDVTGRWVTPETRTHEPIAEETQLLSSFIKEKLPAALGRELYSKTCMYDLTPDRDFILDFLPGHPRVAVGQGAGHAAKFSGLIGEILSELVITGRSQYPIKAFKADRPALIDPTLQLEDFAMRE